MGTSNSACRLDAKGTDGSGSSPAKAASKAARLTPFSSADGQRVCRKSRKPASAFAAWTADGAWPNSGASCALQQSASAAKAITPNSLELFRICQSVAKVRSNATKRPEDLGG